MNNTFTTNVNVSDTDSSPFCVPENEDDPNSSSSDQTFFLDASAGSFAFIPEPASISFVNLEREDNMTFSAASTLIPEVSASTAWNIHDTSLSNHTADWSHEKNPSSITPFSIYNENEPINGFQWNHSSPKVHPQDSKPKQQVNSKTQEQSGENSQSNNTLWDPAFLRVRAHSKKSTRNATKSKKETTDIAEYFHRPTRTSEKNSFKGALRRLGALKSYIGFDYIPSRTKRVITFKGGFPVGSKRHVRLFLSNGPIGVGSFYSLFVKALSDFCRDPRHFKLEAQKTYHLLYINADQFDSKELQQGTLHKRSTGTTVYTDVYLNDLGTAVKGKYFVCDLNRGHDCDCYRRIHGIDLNTFEKMRLFPRYINGREYYIVGFGFYASNPTTSFRSNKYDKFCLVVSIDGHFVLFDRPFLAKVDFFSDPHTAETLFEAMKEASLRGEIAGDIYHELKKADQNFDNFLRIFSPHEAPQLPLGFQKIDPLAVQDVADDAIRLCQTRPFSKTIIVKEGRCLKPEGTARNGIFVYSGGNPTPLFPSRWLNSVGFINFCSTDFSVTNSFPAVETTTIASSDDAESKENSSKSPRRPPLEQSSDDSFTLN